MLHYTFFTPVLDIKFKRQQIKINIFYNIYKYK